MKKQVDFIFDFASPNAYFSYKVLPQIVERSGATLNISPCLLGGIFKETGNQPPMVTFAKVKGKMEYEMLESERFVTRHGLTRFKFNSSFPVNTLLLMRGALVAEGDGRLSEYVDAGLRSMWEDDKKMDDVEVFVSEMDASGFDGEDIVKRTQDAEIKSRLIANTNAAVSRGVFGIPTFFVGNEMFFGKDRLHQVEETLKIS
jgi:2-hydroxychromene-2-carboxylate isomerase